MYVQWVLQKGMNQFRTLVDFDWPVCVDGQRGDVSVLVVADVVQ